MSDLVVVSLERWDDVWRRNQHLVDGLLRMDASLRVLFVEPAADPLHDALSRRIPSFGRRPAPHASVDRLWTFRPVKSLPRRVDPRVDERLARAIMRAARRVGFDSPLLWINDPGMAPVMESSGWPTLYDITDDWLAADRPAAERARWARGEGALLEHAAEVVACSPELVRRKAPARPPAQHPISLVRNAVDVAAYRAPRSRPHDLPTGGTAVYAGTIHADRFDVGLAVETARDLSAHDAALVLVGPNLLSAADSAELSDAGALLLGPRTPEQLVGYLQHASVLVVPHVVSPFTDSLDPIKLYEYQAAARPVVSTPVAGFRDAADGTVAVVTPVDFSRAVLRAVQAPLDGVAEPVATPPDWSDRVHEMGGVLDRLLRAGD